ncbi:hypothetical protein BDV10DRAFT_154534 [Aspergillus recurvatus]
MSISVSLKGGVFFFSSLASSFAKVVPPFISSRNCTSFSDSGLSNVQFRMGHFWRSERPAGQNMTSREPGPRVFS